MACRQLLVTVIVLTFGLWSDVSAQQAAPAPSGHWVGTLEAGASLGVEVDLARQGADGWRGTFSVPAQGQKGIPLSDLTVKNTTVEFVIKGGMASPRFKGELSADGKTITGTFSQGDGSLPLTLTWKGEPQSEAPVNNAAVSKALLGTWEGTLNVKETTLRLVLTLANGPDGATGKLVSVDQNNVEIPVTKAAEYAVTIRVYDVNGNAGNTRVVVRK